MFNSKTKPPAAPAAPVTPADRAATHALKAESFLGKTEGVKRGPLADLHASQATAHATLALYYQREAQA